MPEPELPKVERNFPVASKNWTRSLPVSATTIVPSGHTATRLEQQAKGNLELVDSALYQALYRLEARRLVKPAWGITEKHRRARFYHLTDAGHAELRAEAARWNRYAATVTAILGAPATA